MRRLVASFVLIGSFASQSVALQSPAAGAPRPAARACPLLTREVVTQVTPYDKAAFDLVMQVPPQEDSVGSGSACTYGGITMQVDPFAPAVFEKQRTKEWVPIADVGDTAYFFDRRGQWAELYVRAGERVLTIQMAVPTGRTAASVQPNVVALARAILAKLK